MKYTIEVSTLELKRLINGICFAADEHNGEEAAKYRKLLNKLRGIGKPARPKPSKWLGQADGSLINLEDPQGPALPPPKPLNGPMQHRDDAWVNYLLSMQNAAAAKVLTQDAENSNRPHTGYICTECAKQLGGVWPEHHCATCHGGVCPECKEHKGLCSVDDWDWPKGSKRPKHGAGRD